ncbi:hypothetical protein L596_008682 [Steinernema carpocapsae]|uniref:Ketoreductase (KR) domain-containing protein n=1 Tax=Steinernema carpocapsae TaxID=34508 RepID=A0A4U5PDR1_STECR|nr:hypothetical protein L596_008682 [Steinernema carpocapsae]
MTEAPSSKGVVLITGGNCGLGLHAAKALHKDGYSIIITSRDETAGNTAAEEIGPGTKSLVLDLCSLDSIDDFLKELKTQTEHIHAVVCNAGVMNCPMKVKNHFFPKTALRCTSKRTTSATSTLSTDFFLSSKAVESS